MLYYTVYEQQCKGQAYKTAKIILLCEKVPCLFCTEPFTCERHSEKTESFELSLQVCMTIANNSHTCIVC